MQRCPLHHGGAASAPLDSAILMLVLTIPGYLLYLRNVTMEIVFECGFCLNLLNVMEVLAKIRLSIIIAFRLRNL